jgi:G6PDH family F420-dependent oxidoreductase
VRSRPGPARRSPEWRAAGRSASDRRGRQRPRLGAAAAELGDGLFATEPDADLVRTWHELGGSGPAYAEMPMAWAPAEEAAVRAVLDKSSFALTGWKVMAELPNPVNFEAATAFITPDQVRAQFACGPDVRRFLEVAQPYVDAGFDRLVTMNGGPDPDGFIDFFARELSAPLRALAPADVTERVGQVS